ncbi:putative protein kinase RLK-Pelle-CrRLK1L-1 family [Helianthus annuus]|nr:putative protein kinase RLK-Pelle-CrRLK1L-1 family [Helianthus annuus]
MEETYQLVCSSLILSLIFPTARGLQYLHEVGIEHRILHRDIKSSNILLDESWKAKTTDFGLSRVGPANTQSTFLSPMYVAQSDILIQG